MEKVRYKKFTKKWFGVIAFLIVMVLIFIPGKKQPSGTFLGSKPAIAQDEESPSENGGDKTEKDGKEGLLSIKNYYI